jgi:hypothetical protein
MVLPTKDPDAFLFEFDILCHTYGYTNDAKKLHLFPSTLKGSTLKWFMGLGESTILYWDDMRKTFLKNINLIVNPEMLKKIFLG